MKRNPWIKRVAIIGALIICVVALLAVYIAAINQLPTQIYSPAQAEFLSRYFAKSVLQATPILNILGAEGTYDLAVLPWRTSRVRANLNAHYEEHEDVNVTVFELNFLGEYELSPPGNTWTIVELFFPFPSNLETLHDVIFQVDGEEPPGVSYSTQGIRWETELHPGESHQVSIRYHADGANTFTYVLPQEQRSDVDIEITVSGLTGTTVSKHSLPATSVDVDGNSEILSWEYPNLIPDRDVQITLPAKLSFTQRVAKLQSDFRALARMAPVLVGSALLSLAAVFHLSGKKPRVESYLLVGCGLALFYPMMTFLSGLVGMTLAAALAVLVIGGLILVFMRLTTAQPNIIWRTAVVLVIFLGVFSLGMLTRWRALLLTLGAFMLLSTFMILYAKRPKPSVPEWPPLAIGASAEGEAHVSPIEAADEPKTAEPPEEELPGSEELHCPYCGKGLQDDFSYCPACGHDSSRIQHCPQCGKVQLLDPEPGNIFCLGCGEALARSNS